MGEALEPGTTVADRYRVERLIGEGGMGAVYEAQNLLTEKRVALKWIQGSSSSGDTAVKRLLREAKLAARIDHPHVVDVYDVGHDDDSVFLVMELLRGETLADMVERRGAIPYDELLGILTPLLHALATVHGQNIIHRDLKPSNIFLCNVTGRDRPVPKLLDFGIARDNEGNTHLTGTGQVLGTPAYMAAEQIDGGVVDERTDVYSMGVILYEGLVGTRPYVGSTVFQVVSRIMAGVPPEAPAAANPDVPEALSRVVMKAIQKDPAARHASVAELARELSPFAPSSSASSSSMYPTMVPAEPARPRRGALWMLVGILVGLAIVVVAVYPLLSDRGAKPAVDVAHEPAPGDAPEPDTDAPDTDAPDADERGADAPDADARDTPSRDTDARDTDARDMDSSDPRAPDTRASDREAAPEAPPRPLDQPPAADPVESEARPPAAPTKRPRRTREPPSPPDSESGENRFGLEPTQF